MLKAFVTVAVTNEDQDLVLAFSREELVPNGADNEESVIIALAVIEGAIDEAAGSIATQGKVLLGDLNQDERKSFIRSRRARRGGHRDRA